jgi:hypothetical protein
LLYNITINSEDLRKAAKLLFGGLSHEARPAF